MSDPTAALFKPLEKFEETLGECFELVTREREAHVHAETAIRRKDKFSMIAAHELRKSVNSMAGWLELFRNETLDEPAASKAIESMNRLVKRQEKIVEELIDVSEKPETKVTLRFAGKERPVRLSEPFEIRFYKRLDRFR
jgi:signal transduction histidine kinase